MASPPAADDRSQKKLKITPLNGCHTVALWNGKFPVNPRLAAPKRLQPTKLKLNKLPNLPLDVLFEIFGHLDPLDLLHLARTTKPFRRVLMRPSAITVWKDARSSVDGLPECPVDLSEPTYANLAFDLHCHNCLRANIRSVNWKLRVRYCAKCSKTCLLPIIQFKKMNNKVILCLPFSKSPGRKEMTFCTLKAKDALLEELKGMEEDKKLDFVTRKRAEIEAITAHAEKCEKWVADIQTSRLDELDKIREERQDEIWYRLGEMGWENEMEDMPYYHTEHTSGLVLFEELPCVKVPKPLTERVWKNIQPELNEFMETMKAFRLERERIELLKRRRLCASVVLNNFKRTCPLILASPNDFLPSSPEFWAWHPVKSIIKSSNNVVVTAKSFENVLQDIFEWTIAWREARINELIDKIRLYDLPYVGSRYSSQLTRLELAVCVFTCDRAMCPDEQRGWGLQEHGYLYYPEYLHHRCNSIRWKEWRKPDDDEEALSLGKGYHKEFARRMWTSKGLQFDEKASTVVRKIVEACGWDWKTMTVNELDKLDPRLVCLKCSWGHQCDGERRVTVRNWRAAVVHCMKRHWGSSMVEWEMLADEEAVNARRLELGGKASDIKLFRCAICRHLPQEPERMALVTLPQHLRVVHGFPQCKEGEHYVRAMYVPLQRPLAVDMKPQSAGYWKAKRDERLDT